MRKLFYSVVSLAAVAAVATPALAQPDRIPEHSIAPVAVGSGVVAGTVVGLGTSEGWWGSTAAGVVLPTSVAGAAVVGGVAGMGTVALVDAALEPCRGFAAIFDLNHGACENGRYVGYASERPATRHVYRHRR